MTTKIKKDLNNTMVMEEWNCEVVNRINRIG
jgi:hypothetical protein